MSLGRLGRPPRDHRRSGGDRHLHEEDRPPVECLRQRTAERRAGGEAEDRRRGPGAPAGLRRRRAARTRPTSTAAAPTACAPRSASSTPSEPARPQPSEAAANSSAPPAPSARLPTSTRTHAAAGQRQPEHERVRAEHGSRSLHRRVQLVDDRRQRERDDRRVGEREPGGEEEQVPDAHMLASSRSTTRPWRTRWRRATRAQTWSGDLKERLRHAWPSARAHGRARSPTSRASRTARARTPRS